MEALRAGSTLLHSILDSNVLHCYVDIDIGGPLE